MKQLTTKYPYTVYADSRQGGRRENQDSCSWGDTPVGFLVTVCDGMGGGPSGKEASAIAANGMLKYIQEHASDKSDRKQLMKEAVDYANAAVLEAAAADPSKKGMGTTLTAVLINDYSAIVAHVGDSRVYQFRHGRKHFRTDDHSLVFLKLKEKEIKTEEEARVHPDSNIILRALGIAPVAKPTIVELAYEKGDRFMLCTDGIWGMFPEKEIVAIAARTQVLSGAVESMVVKVDEEGFATGGTHDNLTLAIIETKKNSKMHEKMSTAQRNIFLILAAVCVLSVLLNVILITRQTPKPHEDKTRVDSLVMVVSGLKEELQETQARLEKAETGHAEFVKKVTEEQDPGQIKVITTQESADVSLRGELEGIMKDVKRLGSMRKGNEKNLLVESVKTRFSAFADKAGSSVVDAGEKEAILAELSKPIAKKDDVGDSKEKVKGHYNAINRSLKKILEKI